MKSVKIRIADDDLETLKAANYQLCFAKKVGTNAYNVVWQSYSDYLSTNTFCWTPQYQLFGSSLFQDNITVQVATNKVQIGLGEQSTLDSAGVLSPASTGGPTTAITMMNDYGAIHPGVNQLSTGIDGNTSYTPIYVTAEAVVKGSTMLEPVDKVLVWFEQRIETSTMFSQQPPLQGQKLASMSYAVEIDLTICNSATKLYSNQEWT